MHVPMLINPDETWWFTLTLLQRAISETPDYSSMQGSTMLLTTCNTKFPQPTVYAQMYPEVTDPLTITHHSKNWFHYLGLR